MLIPKVQNMASPKSGHPVANQYIITMTNGNGNKVEIFQSYWTIIAMKIYENTHTRVLLDENDWNYSRTTGKYRNVFLHENTAETRKKIKDEVYELSDLNV